MQEFSFFILFEGIDGSGKSTQAKRFYNYLIEKEVSASLLAEPSTGEYGQKIRTLLRGTDHPEAQYMNELFILDREDDVKTNISPALDKGDTVVLDRYYYSNVAYQGAMGMTPEAILMANRERGFPEPTRIYFIDINPEEALTRVTNRNSEVDTEIFERLDFLKNVRNIYLRYATEHFVIIDGALSEDEVFNQIRSDFENHILYKFNEE